MQTIGKGTDLQIQSDVISELRYDPKAKATAIGVSVKDGVVTLSGSASNYGEKQAASRAAGRVAGVDAIVDEIEILLQESQIWDDSEIAAAAAHRIVWSPLIPSGSVHPTVRDGWVSLEEAGRIAWNAPGVALVDNQIKAI